MAMKLPLDVVREIFKIFSTPMAICKPKVFPWFLGQICSGWRNAFLSMSEHFWGDLVIDLSPIKNPFRFPSSVTYYERALDILKICMDHSAGHPLSIYLFMDSSYYAEEHIFVVDILEALIGQSMRWQKVHFHLQEVELQRLQRVKGHIPLLQSITLTRIYDPYFSWTPVKPVNERFADSFSDSPSLTHLHISAITTWKFDWSSILVLKLLEPLMDIENLLSILPQATRLEELELGRVNDYSRPIHERIQNVVTLPSLKKTVFHGLYILDVLAAPNLVHLSLIRCGSSYGDIDASIVPFIRRSSCLLEHLQLWNVEPAIVAKVLPLLHSLIRLQCHSTDLEGLITSLNCDLPGNEPPRVPRLKSLEVSPDELHQKLVAGLSAMVASRARNPKVDVLQELVVSTDGSHTDVDLTALQMKCEEQGVNLTVSGCK
ncbi:hypothetical protein F5887DRAFT_1072375 [Amanita rubescens]|nr:hypothetical protein F5887DRAFT_1072375 [Amanita rubescens]